MKRLSNIFKFSVFTLLVAALVLSSFDVSAGTALAISGGFNASLFLISGIVPMPNGILGIYVGAGSNDQGAMVQVLNTERERADHLVNSTNPRFSNARLAPGYLRLEASFNNANGKITFKTFIGDGTTVNPTERRLDRNDAFIATSMRFGLLKQDTANGKTNGEIVYYPNITIFGAAAAGHLKSVYQGYLNINIDDKDEVKAFPMQRFLEIPETQQTASTNFDQRNALSALVPCIPNIILDGDRKNEISIVFPTYAGWAGATSADAGFTHFGVLEFYGFDALGGSKGR